MRQQSCLERALQIKEKHYGLLHPEVGITLYNLGIAHWSMEDRPVALTCVARAHSLLASSDLGSGHPHAQIARETLQKMQELQQMGIAANESNAYRIRFPDIFQKMQELQQQAGKLYDSYSETYTDYESNAFRLFGRNSRKAPGEHNIDDDCKRPWAWRVNRSGAHGPGKTIVKVPHVIDDNNSLPKGLKVELPLYRSLELETGAAMFIPLATDMQIGELGPHWQFALVSKDPEECEGGMAVSSIVHCQPEGLPGGVTFADPVLLRLPLPHTSERTE
eukprot:4622006-Amphidinium_carterae.1